MIISRTPFRISFCGGGSDMPYFYEKHGGCVISTTINKYVYLTLNESFTPGKSTIKYSSVEQFSSVDEINHPIFRECMRDYNLDSVEICSTADIPAGTGLGSSSSFTVGLLNLFSKYKGESASKEFLADAACRIEIDRLGDPIGKQDQYAAAYGGFNFYEFKKGGSVEVTPMDISEPDLERMNRNLLMVYTGKTRKASEILVKQNQKFKKGDTEENTLQLCRLTEDLRRELLAGNIDHLGKALREGWELKKTLADTVSSPEIDKVYQTAMDCGAEGGKLLGAGGGGFLLFYAPQECHSTIIKNLKGLRNIPFGFEKEGSSVIYDGSFGRGEQY